jgi:hypothetical protein
VTWPLPDSRFIPWRPPVQPAGHHPQCRFGKSHAPEIVQVNHRYARNRQIIQSRMTSL